MHENLILVVEDDDGIRESVVDILEGEGFKVIAVKNGCEALDTLERGIKPCWVLLDQFMPKMNGTECLKKIRENRDFQDLQITMLSAGANIQKETKQFNVDFVKKPITIDNLISTAEKFCRNCHVA